MKVGNLIYDSDYGLFGLVVESSETGKYFTVFYEDGEAVDMPPEEVQVVQ